MGGGLELFSFNCGWNQSHVVLCFSVCVFVFGIGGFVGLLFLIVGVWIWGVVVLVCQVALLVWVFVWVCFVCLLGCVCVCVCV